MSRRATIATTCRVRLSKATLANYTSGFCPMKLRNSSALILTWPDFFCGGFVALGISNLEWATRIAR